VCDEDTPIDPRFPAPYFLLKWPGRDDKIFPPDIPVGFPFFHQFGPQQFLALKKVVLVSLTTHSDFTVVPFMSVEELVYITDKFTVPNLRT